jgi:hypothetical protein
VIIIGVTKSTPKFFRGILQGVELDSEAVGDPAIANTVLTITQSQAARKAHTGVLDDKGESIGAGCAAGPRDLPLESRFKATLNRLLGGEPSCSSLAFLVSCQPQPIFKPYRISNQVE